MNLVDSCGWLQHFADTPHADFYAPAIEDTTALIVPTICILELFKRVLQQGGEDAALQIVAVMHQGRVVSLTESIPASPSAQDMNPGFRPATAIERSFRPQVV